MLLYALALTHGRSALKEYLPKSKQPSPFPRSPHCDETVQKKFACRITKTRRRFAVLAITGNRAANWRRRGIRQFLPFRVTYFEETSATFRSASTLAVAK